MLSPVPASEFLLYTEPTEYTYISSIILRYVLTDHNITALDKNIYLYLYDHAKFDNDLKCTITNQGIAEIFNVSTKTIYRSLSNLKTNLYLSTGMDKNVHLTKNIQIMIPPQLFELLKKNYENKKLSTGMDKNVLLSTKNIQKRGGKDKNVHEGRTKLSTTPLINTISTITNKKVLYSSASAERIFFNSSSSIGANSDHFHSAQELAGRLTEKLKMTEPAINEVLENKIKRELQRLELDDFIIRTLTEEIIYSIQHGSLKTSKKTGKALAPLEAIKIAVALIKNGRWKTPGGFKK